jgi:mannose-6-phosphate isomerase-like protein (cupin superfamily)
MDFQIESVALKTENCIQIRIQTSHDVEILYSHKLKMLKFKVEKSEENGKQKNSLVSVS